MQIKVRPTVREVVAIYTIDEGSTELVIQLPHNFPLGPVSVDSGKRVGVTAAQWRTWILQLTTFLQVSFTPHGALGVESTSTFWRLHMGWLF